jgi:hypothetical protein
MQLSGQIFLGFVHAKKDIVLEILESNVFKRQSRVLVSAKIFSLEPRSTQSLTYKF